MHFKQIAIVTKYQTQDIIDHVNLLANHLKQVGANVYIDCNNCSDTDFTSFTKGNINDYLTDLDLVIVVGGDGTLLSVGRIVANHDVPIIGVNKGKLGFMTDIAADEMLQKLDSILIEGSYTIEQRDLLNANVIRHNKVVYTAIALNDVVISRGAIGNMIEFDIKIDGEFVLSQKSDGIIFATPTGSTAYSLAAGGPILHPHSNVFAIVPICPQSLTNRPLVVGNLVAIEFTLIRENATQIHFDGQECFDLEYHDQVILSKHPKTLRLIHPHGYNYYRTLRKKLDWSKRVS